MIGEALSIVRKHYATYVDQRTNGKESHKRRLIISFAFACVMASLVKSISNEASSVLITSVSILVGFSFSALFSSIAKMHLGLPKPKYDEDRDDLKILKKISTNFQVNVKYFIFISVVFLIFVVFGMLSYDFEFLRRVYSYNFYYINLIFYFSIGGIINFIYKIILFFLYFECIYTFYRLSDVILNALRIRVKYEEEKERN